MTRQIILNFHGIGVCSRPFEPEEERYWISVDQFEQILDHAADQAAKGRVLFTFDDGNKSDIEIALPRLAARRASARFFVLAGKLDTPSYLSTVDLHTMQAQGMLIGSHGVHHVDWRSVWGDDLEREVAGSRATLECLLGRPVAEVAIPFGGYNRRVIRAISKAGYRLAFTSDGGPATSSSWVKPRISIRQDSTINQIERLIAPPFSGTWRMNRNVRMLAKRYVF